MNKRLLKTALGIAITCSAAVSGHAATVFTMAGATGSSITGTGSSETVTIDWNTLSVGSTQYAGTYVETYTNTGTLTLTEGGSTIMSIGEAASLAGTFSNTTFQLYSAPTSLLIEGALLTELGLSSSPPLVDLTAGSYSVTASGSGSNTATSESSQFTITPEPSTFALFGLALLSAAGYKARKRRI